MRSSGSSRQFPRRTYPGADRLEHVPGRIHDEAALRLGFRGRRRRHRRGQGRGLIDQAAELLVRQRVPLLAGVLVTPAAVLVEPPDVRPEVTDGPGQFRQVVPVHAAHHGGQLQADAGFIGDQPGRRHHLVEVGLVPPHLAVHLGRRALDGDADQGEVGQPQPLVKAPAQELAVGVEHRGLAAPPEGGRVLADLAEQQRLPAAEGHRAGGRGRERLEDVIPVLDWVLPRHRPVAEVAGEVTVTRCPPVDRRNLSLRPGRQRRAFRFSQRSASAQRASSSNQKSVHRRPCQWRRMGVS